MLKKHNTKTLTKKKIILINNLETLIFITVGIYKTIIFHIQGILIYI